MMNSNTFRGTLPSATTLATLAPALAPAPGVPVPDVVSYLILAAFARCCSTAYEKKVMWCSNNLNISFKEFEK